MAILAVALALRLLMLLGPFGELEGDEAIVGLMALHILKGELFTFYWGQAYLGSLEPMLAALAFVVLGQSTLVLKLVPTLLSVCFIGLVYLTAQRLFGRGPALASAAYLAVPPSFFAIWSTKPRGGYIEMLLLGQLLILLALSARTSPSALRMLGIGLLGGLVFWTNQLSLVYLAPVAVWLILGVGWRPGYLAAGMGGFLVGAAPFLVANVRDGFPTLDAMAESSSAPLDLLRIAFSVGRYGLPVLMGMAQGTADHDNFVLSWPRYLAASPLMAVVAALVVLMVVWGFRRSLLGGLRTGRADGHGAGLLLMVLLATLALMPWTRFSELFSEPRYALPAYSAVPLFFGALWRLGRLPVAAGLVAASGLNLYSLLTADPRLVLPTTDGNGNAQTRGQLARFLNAAGLREVYGDYWIVYPLAFETRERVIPAVILYGFDRFEPYAHLVHTSDRPAFIMVADSNEERDFLHRMELSQARWRAASVSVYRVFYDIEPVDPLRP